MRQRNWYTIFLLSTCIVAGMIYIAGLYAPNSMKLARTALHYVFNPSEGSFSTGTFWTDGTEEDVVADDAAADNADATNENATNENANGSGENATVNSDPNTSGQGSVEPAKAELPQIPDDFTGVLFIGDSRTVGLSEYGKLGNADVFADTGMSVYNVTKKALPAPDGEKHTLDERLQEKNYQAILLMLGINELGYDRNVSYKRYGELVAHIRELQPDAWIVLEANLHVTQEQSEKDDIFNNDNINQVNDNIRRLAQENGLGYLDVNVLFDDENGCLGAEYSADGAHVLGSYYDDWSTWILQELQSGAAENV